MFNKSAFALAFCAAALFSGHSLAQWQGNDFYQQPSPAKKTRVDNSPDAANAIELVKQEQAVRQRNEQDLKAQAQETKLNLDMLQQQISDLQKKVAQQEIALRHLIESAPSRGAEAGPKAR